MGRESHRTEILDAARRVLEDRGLTAITFEAVAAEAGVTKGGLLYHFRSKDQLLLALHEHLARQWHDELLAELGTPFDDADGAARLTAYIRVSARSVTRGELMMMLDAAGRPDFHAPWARVIERWTPPAEPGADHEGLDRLGRRLAADGLWFYEAFLGARLDPVLRRRLVDHLSAPLRP